MNWFTTDVTADEERAIAGFMARLAATPVPQPPALAGHAAIWWKAQLLRRWDEQRQAAKPLAVMEPIQLVAALTTAALVFLWALPSLASAVSQVMTTVRPVPFPIRNLPTVSTAASGIPVRFVELTITPRLNTILALEPKLNGDAATPSDAFGA